MHNRLPEGAVSREITPREGLVIVPLVACIVAIALYPALILDRGEASVERTVWRGRDRGLRRARPAVRVEARRARSRPEEAAVDADGLGEQAAPEPGGSEIVEAGVAP